MQSRFRSKPEKTASTAVQRSRRLRVGEDLPKTGRDKGGMAKTARRTRARTWDEAGQDEEQSCFTKKDLSNNNCDKTIVRTILITIMITRRLIVVLEIMLLEVMITTIIITVIPARTARMVLPLLLMLLLLMMMMMRMRMRMMMMIMMMMMM